MTGLTSSPSVEIVPDVPLGGLAVIVGKVATVNRELADCYSERDFLVHVAPIISATSNHGLDLLSQGQANARAESPQAQRDFHAQLDVLRAQNQLLLDENRARLDRAKNQMRQLFEFLRTQEEFLKRLGLFYCMGQDPGSDVITVFLTVNCPGDFADELEKIPTGACAAWKSLPENDRSKARADLPEFLEQAAVGVRMLMLHSGKAHSERIEAFRAFAAQYARVGLDDGALSRDVESFGCGEYLMELEVRKIRVPKCARNGFDASADSLAEGFEGLFVALGKLSGLREKAFKRVIVELETEIAAIRLFMNDPGSFYANYGIRRDESREACWKIDAPGYLVQYERALRRAEWELSELAKS